MSRKEKGEIIQPKKHSCSRHFNPNLVGKKQDKDKGPLIYRNEKRSSENKTKNLLEKTSSKTSLQAQYDSDLIDPYTDYSILFKPPYYTRNKKK